MDADRFDAFSKTVVTGFGRRRMLSTLLSGTMASLLAGLETDARPKKTQSKDHGYTHDRHRHGGASGHHAGAKRKAHGQPHAERNRKGKKRRKKSPASPLPPLPPGCQNCNECQMCQDGACVPDTSQGGVPCQGSGALCNYCLDGVCTATQQHPCDDGVCVHRGQCCPGQRKCDDLGMPEGFYCIPETNCCPGLKRCPNGTCIIVEACCPGQRKCPDNSCIPAGQTCSCGPGKAPCGGSCIDTSVYQCCGDKVCWVDSICCDGYCCHAGMHCCGTTCCFD
jgi:hypothetical protein